MRGLFVTGTDTGVGKTQVAAALAHLMANQGVNVRPRKPIESGCTQNANGLLPQDALPLKQQHVVEIHWTWFALFNCNRRSLRNVQQHKLAYKYLLATWNKLVWLVPILTIFC